MKKILHHIVMAMAVFVLGGTVSAHAETVSQRQAKHIAQQFFNAAYGRVMGEPKLVLQAGGLVVISAENKAFPILGYDLNDNFNPDNMTAALKELLRLYALHIEYIRYDSTQPHEAEKAWQNIRE